jgi:nicotinamidase-related amidase
MNIQDYVNLFKAGKKANQRVVGLCGRIIRGTKPDDFKTLTDDPKRKLVMLMGPDGLDQLLGKTGYEMLVEIGYEKDYIVRKVNENNQFKLVVFKEGDTAKLATWKNVMDIVANVYPGIGDKLRNQLDTLVRTHFKAFEKLARFNFADVDKEGATNPNYMTYERYKTAEDNLLNARAFLYYTIHLRELFAGDGYTYTYDGKRGLTEFIVANAPIRDLGDHVIIDVDVILPTVKKGVIAMKNKLQIPDFFDPNTVDQTRRVPYQEIALKARQYAKVNNLKPAVKDKTKIALVPIDVQNTFCIPGFELFVGGAVEDTERLCRFIYENLNFITQIAPTIDTHTAMQIFHEEFFINDNGEHPAPMTMITLADLEKGVWKVNPAVANNIFNGNYIALQKHVIHYAERLAQRGKYILTIWPYHAMLGGIGHALVPALEEAAFFHNIARNAQTDFKIKGGNPLTENYSVLRPEVLDTAGGKPIAQKNTAFIKKLLEFDAVIIAGQAKSHCVAFTIDDLLNEINAIDPALAKKVYLLEDCTSPVIVPGIIDFTDDANKAFERFRDAGMNIVRTTDPLDQWPGINL